MVHLYINEFALPNLSLVRASRGSKKPLATIAAEYY